MSEMENNKINEEQLDNVAGGNDGRGEGTYSEIGRASCRERVFRAV